MKIFAKNERQGFQRQQRVLYVREDHTHISVLAEIPVCIIIPLIVLNMKRRGGQLVFERLLERHGLNRVRETVRAALERLGLLLLLPRALFKKNSTVKAILGRKLWFKEVLSERYDSQEHFLEKEMLVEESRFPCPQRMSVSHLLEHKN